MAINFRLMIHKLSFQILLPWKIFCVATYPILVEYKGHTTKALQKTCFCVPIKMRGIILALQHVQLFSSLHIFSSAFIMAQETSSKYNGRSSARDNHVLRYVFFLTFSSMLFFIRNRTGKKQPTEWLVSRIVSYLFVSCI